MYVRTSLVRIHEAHSGYEVTRETDGVVVIDRHASMVDGAPYVCLRCDAPHPVSQLRCGLCGAHFSVVTASKADVRRAAQARSLANTEAIKENKLPTGVDWLDRVLGGGIPDYACWLLSGGEGSGKSTLALMALANLRTKDAPLIVSTEMHSSEVASYAKRLGVRSDAQVRGTEDNITTPRRVIALAKEYRAGAILVDSIGDLQDDDAHITAIKQLKNWAVNHHRPVILISQVNSKNEALGPRKRRHDITLYTQMWKAEGGGDLRYFKMAKSRHDIDGQTITLRRSREDGRLEYVPPATPKAEEKPADGSATVK